MPGSGRPSGEGNGNPHQYSYLINPMDRGAWRTTVHRVTELDTTERLSINTGTKIFLSILTQNPASIHLQLQRMPLGGQDLENALDIGICGPHSWIPSLLCAFAFSTCLTLFFPQAYVCVPPGGKNGFCRLCRRRSYCVLGASWPLYSRRDHTLRRFWNGCSNRASGSLPVVEHEGIDLINSWQV